MPIKLRVNGAWVDVLAAIGSPPGAPGNVVATSTVSGQVDVSWSAPANPGSSPINGYTVVAKNLSTGVVSTKPAAASARSASITNLVVAASYSVYVVATNASGPSPASTATTLTVAGSAGSGSGAGMNSSGSNVGEFGTGTFAGYRGPTNVGPYAVFDTGLGRLVSSADLSDYSGNNLSGDITFATDNAIYFRKKIRADRITITGKNVQFIQCDFKSNDGSRSKTGSYFITISGAGNKAFFTDSVIDGNGVSGPFTSPFPTGYGFESLFTSTGSPQILRCELKGAQDIMKSMHNAYIGYSWLHGNVFFWANSSSSSHTHSDHVQIASSSFNDSTVEYCTMGTPKSVAVAAGTDWTQYESYAIVGPPNEYDFVNGGLVQIGSGFSSSNTITGLLFQYNYGNDGAFFMHGENSNAGHVDGLFHGNRCGPYQQFGAKYSQFGNAAIDGSRLTLDGTNVYDDDFIAYWDGSRRTKDQVFA